MPSRPLAFDLFSGAGGLSLGFEQAGFDVAGAIDVDPVHCAIHRRNFPDSPVFAAGVDQVDPVAILAAAGLNPGDLSVVIGGPPCQGFSLIGKRAVDDARNTLIFHFLRFVAAAQPRYFVFENVPGIASGAARQYLDVFCDEALALGYAVERPIRILRAVDFGVPQDRRRVFVLGRRADLPAFPYPTPTHGGLGLPATPTVRDALGDLPDIEAFDDLWDDDVLTSALGPASAFAATLRGDVHDPEDFSRPRKAPPGLTGCLRSNHSALSRSRFAATPPGRTELVSRFHKLAWDGVCNTLRAGTGTERGAFTSPRPIHPAFPRCISVREAARLHSYPDWFAFHVTKWHGFRQIGNSVPPRLGRAVAREVLAALGEQPSRIAEPLLLGPESLRTLNVTEAGALFGVPRDARPRRLRDTGIEPPAASATPPGTAAWPPGP